jgi:hypothetical protein
LAINNYLSEKIDDKQDIDNEKIAKVINLNSHIFTHEPSPQEYHNQKAQKFVFAFL